MRKGIGIDLDSVTCESYDYLIHLGKGFFKKEPVNIGLYNTGRIFEVSEAENNAFWNAITPSYYETVPAKENARDTIKRLSEKADIFFITSRPKSLKKETLRWLIKNGMSDFPFSVIHTTKKEEACRRMGIDVMVEDEPDFIQAVSGVTDVIAFAYPYNVDVRRRSKVHSASSWAEVENLISEIL